MKLHEILLRPTDVLFFRDGRPMAGSLAGHTAAWPLPDVTSHALHAALHRAGLEGVHAHRIGSGGQITGGRNRKFGSVVTAGPFPVRHDGAWFFPRPKDAQLNGSTEVTLLPLASFPGTADGSSWRASSLPQPLEHAVANRFKAEKELGGEPWISREAFEAYLRSSPLPLGPAHFLADESLADHESSLGIAIDAATQTAEEGKIYSAHYLRLRDGFRMGVVAGAEDKEFRHPEHGNDLVKTLINGHPPQIVVGGQQRICTAQARLAAELPWPKGLSRNADFCRLPNGNFTVKWILLSPAVWPEIPAIKRDGSPQAPHPGGWLPNWVFVDWNPEAREARTNPRNGAVLLTAGPGVRKSQRKKTVPGDQIAARLVAAVVPKPLVVTGWSLKGEPGETAGGGGAKPTHLAVPAGAVYYFETTSAENAARLAVVLNWHGNSQGAEITNRRSTLLGEKGYGLGLCGTWNFLENVAGRSSSRS